MTLPSFLNSAPAWVWILCIIIIVIIIAVIVKSISESCMITPEHFNSGIIEKYTPQASTAIISADQLRPGNNEVYLVKFYAPWCGYCRKMEPTWDQLQEQFHKKKINNLTVHILRVNCDENPKIGEQFGVNGFPTVKFISTKSSEDYNGPRDAQSIQNFLVQKCKE